VDLDPFRTAALLSGTSFVDDVSDDQVAAALESGRYHPTESYDHVGGFDIAVITVPTPLRESLPDLSFIESAAASLAPHLKPGSTVILESTTYPGTTEELLVPILESGSGLRGGTDFFVGYSPERIDPGNPVWNFVNTPKVVSGLGPEALRRIDAFYGSLVERTVPVSSPKEAELTKLLENTFRHVNIALVNELAIFAHQLGVNVWEAIDAAASKPFGFMKFTPGPGVGGHCLPVDPSYLSWQVKRQLGQNFRFVELANDVNDHMPDYVLQRVIRLLNDEGKGLKHSRILLVGLSYKRNSGDIRESPSLRLIELLCEFGATIMAVDPHVSDRQWPEAVQRVDFTDSVLGETDLVVLVTDHDSFDLRTLENQGVPVLDTRNRVRGPAVTAL
jgi:nucleotide sugar dehydrogenase